MTPAEADARIILSRRVIATWERMGGLGGTAEGTLRLVNNEIEILENIRVEHGSKADKVARLISRYAALRESLKLQLH